METDRRLYKYLNENLRKSVNMADLDNLCFSLFCTTDILPETLQSLEITKEVLAGTFTRIAVDKNSSETGTKNYWISLIDRSLGIGKEPDMKKARTLLGTESNKN